MTKNENLEKIASEMYDSYERYVFALYALDPENDYFPTYDEYLEDARSATAE